MLNILDRYIIKKFIGTFVFMLLAFVVVIIVIDLSENIDDFVKSKATFGQIAIYYFVNHAIFYASLLSNFVVFLTVIWFTSKMAQRSEIVAILCGGVSYLRFLRPYFIASAIWVSVSLLLVHYLVPRSNAIKYNFEVQYLKGALSVDLTNMHREIEPGTIAYFYRINPATQSGSNFSLERWNNGRLEWKLISTAAIYHPETNRWTISNAQIRAIDSLGIERNSFRQTLDTTLNMTVEDFGLRKEIMNAMNTRELTAFIEDQKLSGSGRAIEFEIEKYNRTANPFSVFVLTFIGVSIASRKQRGGIGLHLLLAIIVGFTYVFVGKITTVSAMTIGFPAWLAVWVPNILYLFVGFYFYSKAQK